MTSLPLKFLLDEIDAEKDTIINDEKFQLIQWKNYESAVSRFG